MVKVHIGDYCSDLFKEPDHYVSGQVTCEELAKVNPGLAIANADGHQYFAENNPAED